MGETTAISWTHHTFNTWDGCEHAPNPDGTTAPECDNCYAQAADKRFFAGKHWGPGTPRKFRNDAYWRKPILWDRAAESAGERRRVFCNSQSDLFEHHPDPSTNDLLDAARAQLFNLILHTPWLDWLLLTKRPDNAAVMLPWMKLGAENYPSANYGKPFPNVWLGTSCGHPSSMWRVETLRRIPAAVRFISCEPMLADFSAAQWDQILRHDGIWHGRIHWLIVGDESGHHRRAAQADWVRSAREAALRHGVAWHFKQWNSPPNASIHAKDPKSKGKIHLPVLDGRQWAEFPEVSRVKLDTKGRATALKVYWSKRERALVYDGEKCTGGLTADVFERQVTSQDTTFVKELERRGYDITTLKLSIDRKPVED